MINNIGVESQNNDATSSDNRLKVRSVIAHKEIKIYENTHEIVRDSYVDE